jgi:hypothetical protein
MTSLEYGLLRTVERRRRVVMILKKLITAIGVAGTLGAAAPAFADWYRPVPAPVVVRHYEGRHDYYRARREREWRRWEHERRERREHHRWHRW